MLETRTWDAADHLASPDDIAEYLSEALKDGDPGYFEHALGVVKILDSLGLAFDVKPVADSVQTVAH